MYTNLDDTINGKKFAIIVYKRDSTDHTNNNSKLYLRFKTPSINRGYNYVGIAKLRFIRPSPYNGVAFDNIE